VLLTGEWQLQGQERVLLTGGWQLHGQEHVLLLTMVSRKPLELRTDQ